VVGDDGEGGAANPSWLLCVPGSMCLRWSFRDTRSRSDPATGGLGCYEGRASFQDRIVVVTVSQASDQGLECAALRASPYSSEQTLKLTLKGIALGKAR
jgi:hypothetical protein